MERGSALTVAEVNDLDVAAFVAAFGAVFEGSPELAAAAASARPFADRAALVAAFDAVAARLDADAALALLRAHPVLGARHAMAPASQHEQAAAGLVDLAEARRERLADGNERYLQRFGFPFILAVAGRSPDEVEAALAARLDHSPEVEWATALAEVRRIAALRIERLVAP